MTDQPGRPPEERLPAPRPSSEPVPAERFSAPPSAHRNDLTPERAAKIVRQSSNARFWGFLAVSVVAIFVIGYYFYALTGFFGLPFLPDVPLLAAQEEHQQVTSVERGYNIYQANCAQCHGVEGEGGVGPALHRQDKLFAHLNPDYLANILEVGGRYACGDPNSIMPIWANTGNPAGPLNYKQVEDLINFIRSEQGHEYRVMNPELWEPVLDPVTKEEVTFEGWVDPNYLPAPGATPYPACWQDEFTGGSSATPAPSGDTGSPAATAAPGAAVVDISAVNIAFEQTDVSVPADTAFTIRFDNKEAVPHNVEIKDASGVSLFKGEIVTGPVVTEYQVPALAAGTYQFTCTVHPNMVGTLTVGG